MITKSNNYFCIDLTSQDLKPPLPVKLILIILMLNQYAMLMSAQIHI